jgi:hypothetical protein
MPGSNAIVGAEQLLVLIRQMDQRPIGDSLAAVIVPPAKVVLKFQPLRNLKQAILCARRASGLTCPLDSQMVIRARIP